MRALRASTGSAGEAIGREIAPDARLADFIAKDPRRAGCLIEIEVPRRGARA
ncbi:MAG: hypothetical protein ABI726_09630 [bacterium]